MTRDVRLQIGASVAAACLIAGCRSVLGIEPLEGEPPAVATEPPSVVLTSPLNGARTGSPHAPRERGLLRPTFRWNASSTSPETRFEIELAPACAAPDCFDAPDVLRVTNLVDTSYRPDEDLPVSELPPVGLRYTWRVRGCVADACGAWSSSRYVDVGRVPNDFNGDGYSDLVVGSDDVSDTAEKIEGKAYVFYGGPGGVAAVAQTKLMGPYEFGSAVAGAGDVNADGFGDLVVGRYHKDTVLLSAYLYLGGPNGLSDPPSVVTNPRDGRFGASLAGAGDVNGDGFADVLVGQYARDTAYLFLGEPGGLPLEPSATMKGQTGPIVFGFGGPLATAGDVDGNGFSDFVIGTFAQTGAIPVAYVYSGSADLGSEIKEPSWGATLANPTFEGFGKSVAGLSDADGDGYSDLLVGSADGPATFASGAADALASGAALPATTIFGAPGTCGAKGCEVAAGGDIDGDGLSDILLVRNSKLDVFRGAPGGFGAGPLDEPWLASIGDPDALWFGGVPAGVGDINGDGLDDVAVGAPPPTYDKAGTVTLFLSVGTGLVISRTLMQPSGTCCYFGISVARAY